MFYFLGNMACCTGDKVYQLVKIDWNTLGSGMNKYNMGISILTSFGSHPVLKIGKGFHWLFTYPLMNNGWKQMSLICH